MSSKRSFGDAFQFAMRKARPYKRRTIRGSRLARLRRPSAATRLRLGVESKFYDTFKHVSNLTAPSEAEGMEHDPTTHLCISAPGQGTTVATRDGSRMVITACHVQGVIQVGPTVDAADPRASNLFMISLVQDTQTNATQLNSEDVYTNSASQSDLATCVMRDPQYTRRFKVLKTIKLRSQLMPAVNDGVTTIAQGEQRIPFKIHMNKLHIPVQFVGTAQGIASVQDNSLHILACALETAGTPNISYTARIRFVG